MPGVSQGSTATREVYTGSHPPSVSGSTGSLDQDGGENVRTVIRIRPLSGKEMASGEVNCIEVQNPQNLRVALKSGVKPYRFHQVMAETALQGQVFAESGVNVLLDAALEGYSSTIFAYGQTGSGKTYTMSGVEENLSRPDYVSDETDGIIPRSISYLWHEMAKRGEKYYVKATFFEIYNEQVRDLLNPGSGVLHTRWNSKKGFFVENLLVVDSHTIDDLIAVLHEGVRNRKTGSHELNKDSSRSHTIMTIYVISEISEGGHMYKRYGKVYFVDLAGSERLKETKSAGGMLKETGNINKSLFNLGKVISSLGDKKNRVLPQHIPYRDSKLTMLLMDSLGGAARTLMIACVSPATVYVEETMSTLNYASRAMNIKNRPLLQVDSTEQTIIGLRRELHMLRLQNEFLKDQVRRTSGGMPPMMVDFANSYNQESSVPPIPLVQELQFEFQKLTEEGMLLREKREEAERSYHQVMMDNSSLRAKLESLEVAFVGSPGIRGEGGQISTDYAISTLLNENENLKRQLSDMIQDQTATRFRMDEQELPTQTHVDVAQLKDVNGQLQKRVEQLQLRERELLQFLQNVQKSRPKSKVTDKPR